MNSEDPIEFDHEVCAEQFYSFTNPVIELSNLRSTEIQSDHNDSQFLSDESVSEFAEILNPDPSKYWAKLIECVETGDSIKLKQVLTASSIDITEVKTKQGLTLLHIAAQNDQAVVLALLLEHAR
jgi:ankyrin repeat protein